MNNSNLILSSLISTLATEEHLISDSRKETLTRFASIVKGDLVQKGSGELIFVCTHNSRRSQLGQLWFKVAAVHFGIEGISTYSGGTEGTAFNHRMVKAVQDAGFVVEQLSDSENPEYLFKVAETDNEGDTLFSKLYHHEYNPQKEFIAVMVCSEADAGCPFVAGASSRVSLPYEDPKEFDDTPQEEKAYADKVLEIGRELIFVVKQIT